MRMAGMSNTHCALPQQRPLVGCYTLSGLQQIPRRFADQDSMAQFWQCCKRMGLPEKHALALLGFHPFASSWADPQAAEQHSAADQLRFSNAFFRCSNTQTLMPMHFWLCSCHSMQRTLFGRMEC